MIVRAEKTKDYTIIHNGILNDERLSLKARGLAAYLLSKPDDWRINRDLLAKQFPDGVWAVRGALKELETCGYLTRTRVQNNGRFTWEIVLHETPAPVVENQPVVPVVEKQPIEKQPVENQPSRVSTVVVSTELPSTETTELPSSLGVTAKIESATATAKPTDADFAIVVAKLESAGVILNALLAEQYNDMLATFGLRPTLDGITAATMQGKQHSFAYVGACARNIYQGNGKPYQKGATTNGNGTAQPATTTETQRSEWADQFPDWQPTAYKFTSGAPLP